MKRACAGVILLLLWTLAIAGDFPIQLNLGRNSPGVLRYGVASDGLKIEYQSSRGKIFHYFVKKFDECSLMALYEIKNNGGLAIDGSCPSQGGQIYQYIYRWDDQVQNWCLRREITGERADQNEGEIVPNENVARVTGCVIPGTDGPFQYASKQITQAAISETLASFHRIASDHVAAKNFVDTLASYDIFELAANIDSRSVGDANDIAYFLIENERPRDAIVLLQKIIVGSPDRVVAKLNLADAYWEVKSYELAGATYRQYRVQMITLGLGRRIPPRVVMRLNRSSAE